MDPCQQPPGPDGNEEADADEEEPSQPSQKRVRFMWSGPDGYNGSGPDSATRLSRFTAL